MRIGHRRQRSALPERPSPGVSPSGPAGTFVSVIMPVRDGMPHLATTLAALLGGDWPAQWMEVLVADGRSTDGSRELVQTWAAADPHRRVRLLDNPLRTTPAGLNAALDAARGEIIVRLDAHALPAADYVRRCVGALRETDAWAVGGPMRTYGDSPFGRAVAAALAHPLGSGGAAFRTREAPGPVDTVYLGAWPRRTFDVVGRFDEELLRNQDYELCVRIRQAGGTVWLDPRIRTTTLTRSTPRALARQYWRYGMGRAATVVRHPRSLRLRQALPAGWVAGVGGLVLAARRVRWTRWVLAVLVAGYGGALAVAARRLVGRSRGPRQSGCWVPAAPVDETLRDVDETAREDERIGHADGEDDVGARDVLTAWAIIHWSWGAGFWTGALKEGGRWIDRELDRMRRV